jgi:protein-S-isoprenylcysteine O-methyltransferase Ste14
MNTSKVFEYISWAWCGSELLLQIVTRTSRSTGTVKDRGSLLILVGAIWASFSGAMWYGETHARNMFGGAPWLATAGLILLVAGLAVRWTAIITLGTSFSTNVAIHATQTVRKTGLYRWMRHPSYTGAIMCFASVGIEERNWVSLAIMLVLPTAALIYRMHVEERALTEAFGQEYIDYSKITKRLVPGIY